MTKSDRAPGLSPGLSPWIVFSGPSQCRFGQEILEACLKFFE